VESYIVITFRLELLSRRFLGVFLMRASDLRSSILPLVVRSCLPRVERAREFLYIIVYGARLAASIFGDADVRMTCTDAVKGNASLILPWLMGNLPIRGGVPHGVLDQGSDVVMTSPLVPHLPNDIYQNHRRDYLLWGISYHGLFWDWKYIHKPIYKGPNQFLMNPPIYQLDENVILTEESNLLMVQTTVREMFNHCIFKNYIIYASMEASAPRKVS
jgi:hypothetical protein